MVMNKTAEALLYLLRCALHNSPPQSIVGVDYEQLYRLSVYHSVVAMTYMALEAGGLLTEDHTSPECIKKWKDAKVKAVRKNVLLDAEREEIFQHFEEQGVWYLPLKGSVLKDMYPRMGMRQMADNDILFDTLYQNQLKKFMENRGYKTTQFGQSGHDVYEKKPIYNFEFHKTLFTSFHNPVWADYYQNVKVKLIKDTDNVCGYHFSDEDFFIYFLLHGYKHYITSGTGIRFLSDIYVFLEKKRACMDWDYLNQEFAKLEILEFASKVQTLANKLFDDKAVALTEEEQFFLTEMMGAGTYGTFEIRVNRALGKEEEEQSVSGIQKIRYIWNRAFPNKEFMRAYNSFCGRHPWSIPFFRIYRLIKGVVRRGKYIIRECIVVYKAK